MRNSFVRILVSSLLSVTLAVVVPTSALATSDESASLGSVESTPSGQLSTAEAFPDLGKTRVGAYAEGVMGFFGNGGPISVVDVEVTGEHATDFFAVTGDGCDRVLTDRVSCTVYIGFLPTQVGQRRATLVVHTNSSSQPTHNYTIKGEGTVGYSVATASGRLAAYGDAPEPEDLANLNAPVVGLTSTVDGEGVWRVASDGGVFSTGSAAFHGSAGSIRLNKPVVGMAATPTGGGYWLVASDGGVFAYGDAGFFGSTGSMRLNKPIVGMTSTSTGEGYWLVASDGGIFAFGDAPFFGSTGAMTLNKPVIGMDRAPFDSGYWLVASDGGIFAFGDAPFYGSTGSMGLAKSIVGLTAMPFGDGYWMIANDGEIYTFGSASYAGNALGLRARDVVGMTSASPRLF